MIDELDRCRPDFALSLVEGAKHLFAVPGIVFLLVTNLDQLCSAVTATYGQDIDARKYLEKFYHLRLLLPEAGGNDDDPNRLRRFLDRIFSKLPSDVGTVGHAGEVHRGLTSHLMLLHRIKGLSLRTLERLATQVAVVYASSSPNQWREATMIADLCLMKVEAPHLYAQIRRTNRLPLQDLESFLDYARLATSPDNATKGGAIIAGNLWRFCLGHSTLLGGLNIEEYKRDMGRMGVRDPSHLLRLTCAWIDGLAFSSATPSTSP